MFSRANLIAFCFFSVLKYEKHESKEHLKLSLLDMRNYSVCDSLKMSFGVKRHNSTRNKKYY